jgi:hypothetical protein
MRAAGAGGMRRVVALVVCGSSIGGNDAGYLCDELLGHWPLGDRRQSPEVWGGSVWTKEEVHAVGTHDRRRDRTARCGNSGTKAMRSTNQDGHGSRLLVSNGPFEVVREREQEPVGRRSPRYGVADHFPALASELV